MVRFDKAITFMIIPFYYEGGHQPISSIWTLDNDNQPDKEDSDYLYPHILNFLKGKMTKNIQNKDALDVYRLNEQSEEYRLFWKKFASKTQIAKIDDLTNVEFKFVTGNPTPLFMAPHLFISQEGNIGILTFAVEPTNIRDLQILENLNYHLHKLQKPLGECMTKGFKLNDRVPEDVKLNVKKEVQHAYNAFYQRDGNDTELAQDFVWNMKQLVSFLLSGFILFCPSRIHLFTFCTCDNNNDNQIFREKILSRLLRLSRCVNNKYILAVEQLEDKTSYLKTFDNIYISASVEGAAMIALATEENKGFISNMEQALERYLWIYVLALIQRYSLLSLDRRISQIKFQVNHDMLPFMNIIGILKSHCSYTEVSPFAQHNQFYKFCCDKLNIINSYEEIEHKSNFLNLVLEQQAEYGQRRLNLLVGILTVFQMADAIFTFTNSEPWENLWPSIATLCIGCLIICLIFRKDILSFFNNHF